MKNCVFCSILRNELPSDKLFEDDLIYCFLDIAPINPGHALIIPKVHHTSITTLPVNYRHRILELAPTIAQAVARAVDADGFNLHLSNGQCAGQVIPHTHLHIIPRSPTDGFSWGWRSILYDDAENKSELISKITSKLMK